MFEHLSDDINVAKALLNKCATLFIITPYKENPLCSEHIRSYDEKYFDELCPDAYRIFNSPGWTEYGIDLLKLNVKNIIRFVFQKQRRAQRRQIMFRFTGLRRSGMDLTITQPAN